MSFNTCPAPAGCVADSGGALSFSAHAPTRVSLIPLEVLPSSPPPPSERSEIIQMVHGCERELRIVQSRLGTAAERADDPQQARELAHKAKNLRFAVELWEQIKARRDLHPRPAA